MNIEDLTIGELRKLVEPLSARDRREAMTVIATCGNSIYSLSLNLGMDTGKFVYLRVKEFLASKQQRPDGREFFTSLQGVKTHG